MISKTWQRTTSALVTFAFLTLAVAAPAFAETTPPPAGSTSGGSGQPNQGGTGGDQGGMIDPNG